MNLIVIVMMMWSCSSLLSQETWKKTYGGSKYDYGQSITTTSDGGSVLTGTTFSNDGDFNGMNKGNDDIFVIKLDTKGEIQWKKLFGGSKYDQGRSITTTPDGGLVLTGSTSSNDGDFNGMNKGDADIFVIKLDSRGDVQWKKTYGGKGENYGQSITTTSDGGILITGFNSGNDGDFEGEVFALGRDIFVMKLDTNGEILWKKLFGGKGEEWGQSITTTPDGGFVLTGFTTSNDGDFNGMNKGDADIFVIKFDTNGEMLWKKLFGGSSKENGQSITTTSDGGILITGYTSSNDIDFKRIKKGLTDIFVIKLDTKGEIQWKKLFGGSKYDWGNSITTTPDGGFVLTGFTTSNDGDFEGMKKSERDTVVPDGVSGPGDIFVIKLDVKGEIQWKKTYGGSGNESGQSFTTTSDGGLLITGETDSDDGDFEGMNKSLEDIFVIKLDSNGNLNSSTSIDVQSDILSSFDITPNPLSSFSTISYSLDKPSHVRIEVVNSIGEVVFVLSDKQEDVGSQQVSFNTTDLVTGTYSIRLIENNRVTSKRVIQMK